MASDTHTADSKEVAQKTVAAIRRKGARGNFFRTYEIRQDLGYDEASEEAHYMHNVIARLKKQGALVQASGDRKRNQYLRIADEDKLRRVGERAALRPRPPAATTTPGNGNGSEVPVPVVAAAGPRRVLYLEDRVDGVEHALEDLAKRQEELLRAQEDFAKGQEALGHRLDELIQLWS